MKKTLITSLFALTALSVTHAGDTPKAEENATNPAPAQAALATDKPVEAAAPVAPSKPATPRVDRKSAGKISDDLNKKCGPVSTQATVTAVAEAVAS